jgi:hypothetical protein
VVEVALPADLAAHELTPLPLSSLALNPLMVVTPFVPTETGEGHVSLHWPPVPVNALDELSVCAACGNPYASIPSQLCVPVDPASGKTVVDGLVAGQVCGFELRASTIWAVEVASRRVVMTVGDPASGHPLWDKVGGLTPDPQRLVVVPGVLSVW